MSDKTRDEEIMAAIEQEQTKADNSFEKEDTEAKKQEESRDDETNKAIKEAGESLDLGDDIFEDDEEPVLEMAADSSSEEAPETEPEVKPDEKEGFYDDLLESDWDLVMAEQEMADKKKAAKEKAKKERRKRQQEEQNRQQISQSYSWSEKQEKDKEETSHYGVKQQEQKSPYSNPEPKREAESIYRYRPEVTEDKAKEDAEQLAIENEKRRKQINEAREAETRRREEQYRKEIYEKADEIRRRENASLGMAAKTSHLDLRAGAQNLEKIDLDRSSTYSENPSPMPDGVSAASVQHRTESGETPSDHSDRSGEAEAVSNRVVHEEPREAESQYTYGIGGSISRMQDAERWSPLKVEVPSQRAEKVLETRTGYADYTPTGVVIHPDIPGKVGYGVPDREVTRVPVKAQTSAADNLHQLKKAQAKQETEGQKPYDLLRDTDAAPKAYFDEPSPHFNSDTVKNNHYFDSDAHYDEPHKSVALSENVDTRSLRETVESVAQKREMSFESPRDSMTSRIAETVKSRDTFKSVSPVKTPP